MKKVVLISAMAMFSVGSMFAQQKVTIKAGTIVPMHSVNSVKAADVDEGQTVDFVVTNDVKVGDVVTISKGTLVKGTVNEAEKSSLAGTKGRLKISITNLILPSGDQIYFSNSNVNISGKNRTPLAVVTALFVWPCIFIPGTKAQMPAGYELQATIGSTIEVTI
ncbi:hypothetical protein [Bacteroides sp.]|uniref:hypothetical protein n=1 Tax=Bacteroides sp. TaxID=29523 RepID=UPI001B7B1897|nr:hypothetical protein [Bacteroides sp.]MBP8622625.1 hypothetical protein [Bacteroides sp.]